MDVIKVQRLLATCVETLIREGCEAEADEAIRQGRVVAKALGPYPKDDPDDVLTALEEAIRAQVLADAGIVDAPAAARFKQ